MADPNSEVEVVPDAAGFTRRGFIAGATVAGAAMLASAATADVGLGDDVKETTQPPTHPHKPRPTCVAATRDGRVVTCDDTGGVHLRTLEPEGKTAFKGGRKTKASYVAVSGTGKVLTAFFDGTVLVSSLADQSRLSVFDDHLAGMGPNTEVWTVAVSYDGAKALSSTNGGEIRYWDVAASRSIARVVGDGESVAALAFLPDDTKFLSGHAGGRMFLWSITDKGLIRGTVFDHLNATTVNAISVFKKNGALMAMTGSFDGQIRVWDLGSLKAPPDRNESPTVLPVRHRHFVWRVAVSPDGTKFASAGEDERVRVFDVNGKQLIPAIEEEGGVMGVAFVSNTRLVHTTGTVGGSQVLFKDL
jgi:WD40 repeat protein